MVSLGERFSLSSSPCSRSRRHTHGTKVRVARPLDVVCCCCLPRPFFLSFFFFRSTVCKAIVSRTCVARPDRLSHSVAIQCTKRKRKKERTNERKTERETRKKGVFCVLSVVWSGGVCCYIPSSPPLVTAHARTQPLSTISIITTTVQYSTALVHLHLHLHPTFEKKRPENTQYKKVRYSEKSTTAVALHCNSAHIAAAQGKNETFELSDRARGEHVMRLWPAIASAFSIARSLETRCEPPREFMSSLLFDSGSSSRQTFPTCEN